jgi:hypothetical protein
VFQVKKLTYCWFDIVVPSPTLRKEGRGGLITQQLPEKMKKVQSCMTRPSKIALF